MNSQFTEIRSGNSIIFLNHSERFFTPDFLRFPAGMKNPLKNLEKLCIFLQNSGFTLIEFP